MKASTIIFGLIKIPVDFLMTLLAFLFAYKIRTFTDLIPGIQLPLDLNSFPKFEDYLIFSFISATGLLIIFALNKMYSLKYPPNIYSQFKKTAITTTICLMVMILYFFLIRSFPFSRLALIYTWLLTIILICFGRLLIHLIKYLFLKAGIGKTNLVFIGDNTVTQKLYDIYKKDKAYKILGIVNNMEELQKIHNIEEIIQIKSNLSSEILDFCREHHIKFSFVPNILEIEHTNIETETYSGIPLIKLKPTPLDGWGRVIKRAFDFFGSLLGLMILSPIFLIISVLIKLDSKGTIFFKYLDDGSRAKRIGKHGKHFNFYKFRTMHPKTHNLRYTELADKNLRAGTALVKIKDDPRVTRIGKFLRRKSLDELPQLINVLKGEMSLVGPRPHLPEEVANYQKHHKFVLTIKPGITGMAQTAGRSDLNFEDEIKLDTYYIKNWSIWLDLKILFKTFGILLKDYKE